MSVYAAVTPAEAKRASDRGYHLLQIAYGINAEGRLAAAPIGLSTRGGIMGLCDTQEAPKEFDTDLACREILFECSSRGYSGVYADFEGALAREGGEFLKQLAEKLGGRRIKLYINDGQTGAPEGAHIVITSAVTGGSYEEYLEGVCERIGAARVTLAVERLRLDYTLPAENAEGRRMEADELSELLITAEPSIFFSSELCAKYFTKTTGDTPRFVLFDDARTISRKLLLARDRGINEAFLPFGDVEDILRELEAE